MYSFRYLFVFTLTQFSFTTHEPQPSSRLLDHYFVEFSRYDAISAEGG